MGVDFDLLAICDVFVGYVDSKWNSMLKKALRKLNRVVLYSLCIIWGDERVTVLNLHMETICVDGEYGLWPFIIIYGMVKR